MYISSENQRKYGPFLKKGFFFNTDNNKKYIVIIKVLQANTKIKNQFFFGINPDAKERREPRHDYLDFENELSLLVQSF